LAVANNEEVYLVSRTKRTFYFDLAFVIKNIFKEGLALYKAIGGLDPLDKSTMPRGLEVDRLNFV
jgi:hypothetical protein